MSARTRSAHATTVEIVPRWWERAACRGADPDLFAAPDEERGPDRVLREEHAKAFCATCPVRQECLDDALLNDDRNSIAGGTTFGERDDGKRPCDGCGERYPRANRRTPYCSRGCADRAREATLRRARLKGAA